MTLSSTRKLVAPTIAAGKRGDGRGWADSHKYKTPVVLCLPVLLRSSEMKKLILEVQKKHDQVLFDFDYEYAQL